ncbi:MAG: peroxide stress protein YaaA [Actinobacteria bacterium]|nr:peroxide stress protein YaaA [Actinomycetota bacterium]
MTDALLLLPPSEGKTPGGDGPPWRDTATGTGPLAPARAELVEALGRALRSRRVDPADVLRYGSADVLARAVVVDLAVDAAATTPAVERYAGVVLEALDRGSLPAAARRRLDRSTWFVSGLWGLVAATDPIPDYRVKIGARVPGLGVLGTWWRPQVTAALDELSGGRFVWDLLTTEHGRVWRRGDGARAVATVAFTTRSRGPRGVSNYHGKHLKGRFARHLVTTGAADVEAAAGFTADGWELDAGASALAGDRPHLVFTAP